MSLANFRFTRLSETSSREYNIRLVLLNEIILNNCSNLTVQGSIIIFFLIENWNE